MRILGLIYDPIIDGRYIHEIKGWTDPYSGLQKAVDDLNLVLPDNQKYTIDFKHLDTLGVSTRSFGVDKLDEIDWGEPYYYNPREWLELWNIFQFAPSRWPYGGDVHVKDFIIRNRLVQLVNAGFYDEVWLAGLPIPAAFEGCMVAPEGDAGAYPTHDRVVYVKGLNRRFVWHMFQVSNWNPIHNYWHRIEAIMSKIWGRSTMGYCEQTNNLTHMSNVQNPWQLFTMTENCMPGEAQVGTCHFAPNSKLGYVHDMADDVPSGAHLWLNYPQGFPLDLNRNDRWQIVNGSTYASLPDYIWQLSHIPKAEGQHDGRDCNWWKYIIDTNYGFGRGQPTSMPWVGTPRPIPNIVTRYGDSVILRWNPRSGDTDETEYELYVDDVLQKKLQRRGPSHINLSTAVSVGTNYKIVSPGVWSNTAIGGNLNKNDMDSIINKLHAPGEIGATCRKPIVHTEISIMQFRLQWDIEGHEMTIPFSRTPEQAEAAYRWYLSQLPCADKPPVEPPVEPPVGPPVSSLVEWAAAHQALMIATTRDMPVLDKLNALEQHLWNKMLEELN